MEVDLTPLQLKDMPVEVLSNIFEFLDAESLKSSRLVSSKWNQIILKSPTLMKKLVLVIDGHRESEFNQISNFSRCYRQIKIQNLKDCEITKNLLKVFREIGSKVKEVRILYCEISSEFEDLIRCFPSVDHAEFVECDAKKGFKFNPEVFAGCKILEVSCRYCLFCFENLQLTKLDSLPITSTDWQLLIDLLAKQTRLTTLSLCICDWIPSEVELVKLQIPVETLSTTFIYEQLRLPEFLNLFGMTVKSLEVTSMRYTDKPFALLDSITSNFKLLTDLTLKGFMFTKQDSNLELLMPLETVNTMQLKKVAFETSEEFSNFFKLFPQLVEIKLDEILIWPGGLDEFLKSLFKLQHIKKFVIDESNWEEKDFYGDFVVLKNKHLSIKIGTKYDQASKRAFNLALKILNTFDLPKDELMMSQHKAQELPEWKLVTDEDFQPMDEKDGELKEIYPIVIQKY